MSAGQAFAEFVRKGRKKAQKIGIDSFKTDRAAWLCHFCFCASVSKLGGRSKLLIPDINPPGSFALPLLQTIRKIMKSDTHSADSPSREYLLPTAILDSDHPDLILYAKDIAGDSLHDPLSAAVKLYYAVRDRIWYDPYAAFYLPEHYRASHVLKSGRGFCIPKAGLLCALARACHIPSRLGFATVRNHLATRQLLEHIGCDLFVFHGYTEFFLHDRWVKVTPAFNKELCLRHGVEPLEFDGREDSVFQSYNAEKKRFMEYVEYHGEYADIPVDEILRAWKKVYGEQRVQTWIERLEKNSGKSWRDFDTEDVTA